jgi:Flp pilus assembly protein TadG
MIDRMKLAFLRRFQARHLRRLARDRQGASAIEFAILLPVMVTLYISGFELSQAISIYRKVTLIAHTVADLVAQTSVPLAPSDVTNSLAAAGVIATPYGTSPLTVVVSQIEVSTSCTATIDWSQASPSTDNIAFGTTITNAAMLSTLRTLAGANSTNTQCTQTYVIWGQASYGYTPQLGYAITGTINLSDQILLSPRLVSCVGYSGSNDALCSNDS